MNTRSSYTLVLLILLASNLAASGTIVGYVRDSSTSGVDNAIVYFSNTYYGCSTDSQGYFALTGLPDGHYWLTISKAGFLRKQVDLEISGADTIHLEIRLLSRPIELEGVEIWADSLGLENPWKSLTGLFIPSSIRNNYTVFNSSGKIPFGMLRLDTISIMYSLDTMIYNENIILRLWVLFLNSSERKLAFDPMHSLALTIIGHQTLSQDIPPIPYQQMTQILNNQDVIQEIELRIGGEINHQSSSHAEIVYYNSTSLGMNFDWGSSLGELSPVIQGILFRGSEKAGILKPYYISPNAAVQGYVYFLFPLNSTESIHSIQLNNFKYFITIELNGAVQTLSFSVN